MTDQWQKAREAAAYALHAVEWENAPGIPHMDELEMPYWLRSVDAALSAFSAAGWELVPREAADAMYQTSVNATQYLPGASPCSRTAWDAMITAALKERQT